MPKLTLVHSLNSDKSHTKTKRRARPDGYLQCNRCGAHSSITIVNGSFIKNGKKQGGTVIHKEVCLECWKKNIIVWMLPELEPVK